MGEDKAKEQVGMPGWSIGTMRFDASIGEAALEIAIAEIGQGEDGRNNITKYSTTEGPWCAAFVAWCLKKAAVALQRTLPFEPSAGARKLFSQIASAGTLVTWPRPGDVVCWRRGRARSWQGHIGFVESSTPQGLIETVEGNVGTFPAHVRRFTHDPSYERIVGYARIV